MKKLYMILPMTLILCFMVGCQDKAAMAELEELKAQAAVEEQNKDLVKRYIEEMNKENAEFIKEVYAPDAKIYFPSGSPKPKSREAQIEGFKGFFGACSDFKMSLEELFAVEDRVIFRFIITGTHEGDLSGIPATGNKLEYGTIVIARIKNGKIIEEKSEAYMLYMMMQLGYELKPKEEK